MFKTLREGKKNRLYYWTSFFSFTLFMVFENKRFHSQTTVKTSSNFKPANLSSLQFFSCFNFVLQVLSSLFHDHLHLYEQNILESFLLHLVIFLAGYWSSFISCHSLIQSANLSCNCLESFLSSRKTIEVCNLSLPYCNCKNGSKQSKPYLTDSYFVTLCLQSIQKWNLVH